MCLISKISFNNSSNIIIKEDKKTFTILRGEGFIEKGEIKILKLN